MAHPPQDDYTPRSPNLSPKLDTTYIPPVHPQHQSYRGSISHSSPFSPTGGADNYFVHQPLYSPAAPTAPYNAFYQQPQPTMVKHEFDDEEYGASRMTRRGKKVKQEEPDATMDHTMGHVANGTSAHDGSVPVEVKTKFPVARIKRIMQHDEDVGKVAQVTPVAVSKALELFMIALITKSAAQAKARSSKRVLPTHLKSAVTTEPEFDFLLSIVSKVADAPSGQQKHGDDSDEGEGKKKRGRRRKADSE